LGTFIEQGIDQFEEMFEILNQSLQTVTYFGINANDLLSKIESLGFLGIDRIVPFGAAFEMTPIWDGIDTIRALSRIIEVR
jgi:hypothetical protein